MSSNVQRDIERYAYINLNGDECPDPDDLAAYLLGTMHGPQQLRVAAHVRACPLCQEHERTLRPVLRRRPLRVARLVPTVLEGVRSASASSMRQYRADDTVVTLVATAEVGELWRLTGQVGRADGTQVAAAHLLLRGGRRRYEQQSDAQGLFAFSALPPARYTLTVDDQVVTVQIRGLVLDADLI